MPNIYILIDDDKTYALAYANYILLINITHVQWGITPNIQT